MPFLPFFCCEKKIKGCCKEEKDQASREDDKRSGGFIEKIGECHGSVSFRGWKMIARRDSEGMREALPCSR